MIAGVTSRPLDWWRFVAFAVFVSTLAGDAGANMAKWWHEGAGHGPLVPQSDTDVRVDSEDLTFAVAPSLDQAAVTATYRMTNGGAAATSAEIAFVVVAPEVAGENVREPRASITIDGAPVPFRVVTDADMLGPALDAWLAAHPEVEPELARLTAPSMNPRYPDVAELRRLVPGCTGECQDLLGWYRDKKNASTARAEPWRQATIVRAAEEAIPAEVAKLQQGWSTLRRGRRLSWLAFQLDFAPSATRTVTVRYDHRAGDDTHKAVSTTFTYDYLLSPAKRWARFGPLHLSILVPRGTRLQASLPLTREGESYRADLAGLPAGELSFEVMSSKGLVFGMTQPAGYWGLLLGALSAVTVALGLRLGGVWARLGSRLRVALACISGTGMVVGLADGLVIWLLSRVLPERAFGYGYDSTVGLLGALVLFAVAGAVLSSVSARAAARRAVARKA
jgi:hypothetical protein